LCVSTGEQQANCAEKHARIVRRSLAVQVALRFWRCACTHLVMAHRTNPPQKAGDIANVVEFQKKGKAFVETHGWLQTALLIIGGIAVLSVFGALFIAAGTEPDKIVTDAQVAPVDSALFANSLSHLVNAPLEQGGTVSI